MIFAILVLGIGLVLMAAAFPVGIKLSEKTQDTTNAALVAQHAFDQITKTPSSGAMATSVWGSTGLPLPAYTGRPLTMGLLDGTMSTRADGTTPDPDLRIKLVYPTALYWDNPSNYDPTWSDCAPQDSNALGHAAYSGTQPVSFWQVWGLRLDNGNWYENVQWVYPADRRYYWYAFYRQMETDPKGYANPVVSTANPQPWTISGNLDPRVETVRQDHATRRTYSVTVVVCKAPGKFTIPYGAASLTLNQIQTPMWFKQKSDAGDVNATPAAWAAQWSQTPGSANGLGPVRLPASDGVDPKVFSYTTGIAGTEIFDTPTPGNTNVYNLINTGVIKSGSVILDAWGSVYTVRGTQIINVMAGKQGSIQLDRAMYDPSQGAMLNSNASLAGVLPLWIMPNAVGIFPTFVTKQADLP